MKSALLAGSLIAGLAGSSTFANVMLPCGKMPVPLLEAEKIWQTDNTVFAFCKVPEGAEISYRNISTGDGTRISSISENPEVLFAEAIDFAEGAAYLRLMTPSALNCEQPPEASHALLSGMDCSFRAQERP